MKKRIVGTVLAFVLCASSLTGCGFIPDSGIQSGPVNQREETQEEDTAGTAQIENSETGSAPAEETDSSSSEEVSFDTELSFDPADRPNATEGTGTPKALDKGDIAPDFTVELVDGGTFTLSDHDDGIVIVNFWATWCGPCVGEMPGFEELYNEGIEKLSIIGINCAEDRDTVDKFVSKKGFTFPIAYDTDIVKHGIIEEIIVGAPGDAYTEYKDAVESLMD